MSKKLEGNGLWESSRMMLPEHKERINRHNRELDLKSRPILDEQKLEMINGALQDAYECGREITLTLFDPKRNYTVRGRVGKFDPINRAIRLAGRWIRLSDIVDCSH